MYGNKNYLIEVILNVITSVQNFMKIYQAVQKLLVGDTVRQTQTDGQTGDLISLLSLLESRLNVIHFFLCVGILYCS
jgi:hypothetical protein